MEHRATPHYAVWEAAAGLCLEPGGRVNRYYTAIVADFADQEAAS